MDIPTIFTEQNKIKTYDFKSINNLLNTEIDKSIFIGNLSIEKSICSSYFKSILLGYNHVFISKLLENYTMSTNICLPLLHQWNGSPQIDNLVIISNTNDAERICKKHIKKAPVFKQLLNTSIISTTDNDDWKEQRQNMNLAFMPKLSLQKIFPKSQERAQECSELLKDLTNNFSKPININDFFLNETQAQLQLSMFGFSDEFQEKTNKKIRDVFSGKNTEYAEEFVQTVIQELQLSNGPLSEVIQTSKDLEQLAGNILIYAFAGHDTTGHTLTWLIYELCKHPEYKQQLIKEIDNYWENNIEESYNTFDQLPFMTKCITETLRLWPALANGTYRELETDEVISGLNGEPVTIPKGTYCQIINWTRHRNPELWGDDVNSFNPNRNFENSEIWDYKGFGTTHVSSDRFSPFTYGPRHCIGKNFSQMEMRLILLNLFKYYDFELDTHQKNTINDDNYMGLNLFTMGPLNIYDTDEILGMFVHVIPRYSRL